TVRLRGTRRLSSDLSVAASTHDLPIRYAVCPSPFQPSSMPDFRSLASALAHWNGVAGSRVVPTTRIGGAPSPRSRTSGAARAGQEAHGTPPPLIPAPHRGRAPAPTAAAPRHAGQARRPRRVPP